MEGTRGKRIGACITMDMNERLCSCNPSAYETAVVHPVEASAVCCLLSKDVGTALEQRLLPVT